MDKKNNFKTAFKEIMKGDITSNGKSTKAPDVGMGQKKDELNIAPEKAFERVENSGINYSILAEDLVLEGNVTSKSKMDIHGTVNGNVTSDGDVLVSGLVSGDIKCQDLEIKSGSVKGSIQSKGTINIDQDSLVVGDISAETLVLRGRIKGNIKVKGSAVLSSTAYAVSDVEAATISIEAGSKVLGSMTIASGKLDDSIFEIGKKAKESGRKAENITEK